MQLGGSPDLEEDLAVEAVGSRPALAVLLLYVRLLHLFAFDLLDPYHPGFQNQKQRLFDIELGGKYYKFLFETCGMGAGIMLIFEVLLELLVIAETEYHEKHIKANETPILTTDP
ncbi:unnamed protein product [Rhizoctonia solani]|uniref:Uncharacterized protein n=1 Tax=Rhizoctonia solani TaxID=456999 RepID=A0A8H2X284_9AGAM|nr:unnamed protein product [Rhizoctonia solani]